VLIVSSLRNLVFAYFVVRWTRRALRQLRGRGVVGTVAGAYLATRRFIYNLFLRLPGVRDKVQLQIAEAKIKMEKKLVPTGPDVVRHLSLPAEGWSAEKVKAELVNLSSMKHTMWEDGRVSGAVYHGGKDLLALQTEAYGLFTVSNPIHPDVFPGVRKMEAEIVAMVSSACYLVRRSWY
jgi:sphinganine-1-phosphate aldolase